MANDPCDPDEKAGRIASSQLHWIMVSLGLFCVVMCLIAAGGDAKSSTEYRSLAELEELPQYPSSDGAFKSTPIPAVLANPQRFTGRRIRIKGFAGIGHGVSILSMNQESLVHGIEGNSIWLDLTYINRERRKEFESRSNGRCCSIVGVIDPSRGGPQGGMDLYPCALLVTSYTIQRDPRSR